MPTRLVDESEAQRMRFRKSIVGEALEILGDPRCNILRDSPFHHSRAQLLQHAMQLLHFSNMAHGAPQLVGLRRRVATELHGDRHRLLLKYRYSLRALENRLQIGMQVRHGLETTPPRRVGMHEIRLDRAGPNE